MAIRGIEIYMPLASDLMLCAWCPSIMEEVRQRYATHSEFEEKMLGLHLAGRISAIELKHQLQATRAAWAPARELIGSVKEGSSLPSDSKNMDFFNSLQSSESSRFIVCQRSDFEVARRHNKEFPHLRKGRRFTVV